MDTRSKKQGDIVPKPSKPPLSPEELEVVRANLSAQEKRLREQADALRVERDEFAQEKEACRRECEEMAQRKEFSLMKERDYEIRDPPFGDRDELMREITNLRRELDLVRVRENVPAPSEH